MARLPSKISLVAFPLLALVGGTMLWWAGDPATARLIFSVGVVVVLAALLLSIGQSLARGVFGLDIIAALAMAGSLWGGQELAGVVVALMYSGGQALERYAQDRAARDMTLLLSKVPRTAKRYGTSGLEDVPLGMLAPGDRLLIAAGEFVPVDGRVAADVAVLDQSALTGEPLPVRRARGANVASGATNAGAPFDLVATATASDSTFAAIVRLVDSARQSKAPMSRLADTYALGFLGLTLALAGVAWSASGTFDRALAVLVVATPCPLILAVPVAIVAGMSRAARHGVLVKEAAALERLARVRTLLLDKTGTVTEGRAVVAGREGDDDDGTEIFRLAASLAQASRHIVSQALVAAAHDKGLSLSTPSVVVEHPGDGVVGTVDGRRVAVGHPVFVAKHSRTQGSGVGGTEDGSSRLAVAVDEHWSTTFILVDPRRPDAARTIERLRDLGIGRILLVTGDQSAVAEKVAADLRIDGWRAEVTASGKVDVVAEEAARAPTLMVGDGINDAAALARATVGIALGARGSAAAAEASDVVLLVDRFDRVADAVEIAQDTRRIAVQSVVVGMALSVVGMIAAAFGYLPPLAGALAQEAIDVAVVLNALRALSGQRA